MGGSQDRFLTTCWTEIISVRSQNETKRKELLSELITRYSRPVYCYLLGKGLNEESAEDLAQDFLTEVVIGREIIGRADKTKGRFRTFLLTALDRYAIDMHNKKNAIKRKPKGERIAIDTSELADRIAAMSDMTPEEIFNHAWATEILTQVIDETKDVYYKNGKGNHWEVFNSKVILPILENSELPVLQDLCEQHGIENDAKASKIIFDAKNKFQLVMYQHLRQLVDDESEIEEEFNEILKILSKK